MSLAHTLNETINFLEEYVENKDEETAKEVFDRSASFEIFKRLLEEETDITAGKALKYWHQFESELNDTI